ncbi:MAG: hypothetical protein ACLTGN_04570 [Clostridium sp.]
MQFRAPMRKINLASDRFNFSSYVPFSIDNERAGLCIYGLRPDGIQIIDRILLLCIRRGRRASCQKTEKSDL